MNVKCGIIGLPNIGKSTLFNVLTNAKTKTLNFPFCTIKPNIGITMVPDSRIHKLTEIVKTKSVIYNTIEFIDIAGLVEGASKGEGMGNQFLEDIRQTEAMVHVVRCFEDENVLHISRNICPSRDINIINTELILYDLGLCERVINKIKKNIKQHNHCELEIKTLEKCLFFLQENNMLSAISLNDKEIQSIRYLNFLTLKPMMYIANIDKNGINNSYIHEINTIANKHGSLVATIYAKMEHNIDYIQYFNKKNKYIIDNNYQTSNIYNLIQTSYKLLKLHTFFTVGTKEIRAWNISLGDTALQAAKKIHTDLGKGFIRAKTISFLDFVNFHGEKGAKEAGKVRYEGKDYIVQDGDIINFLFKV